jgi:hypothetical protein
MAREVAVVPDALAPVWKDLPALSWVAARAYAPTNAPNWLAAFLAAMALPLWLFSFIGMRRSIAASRRQAVVTISRLKDPRLLTLLAAGLLVVLLVVLGVLIAQRSIWAIVVGAALINLSAMQPWRLAAQHGAMSRVYLTLRERDPHVPVYELGGLAAWPQGHGHGWRLLESLLAETDIEGYVVAFPRDAELRRRYLQMGMVELEAGGALYLDLRNRGTRSLP